MTFDVSQDSDRATVDQHKLHLALPSALLLILIVIAAAMLRFIHIGANEANFDELWHLELSTGCGSAHETLPMNVIIDAAPAATSLEGAPPWYRIPTSLDTVTHPPLYPMLLRGWRATFGESIVAGRMFSAVLSTLCVPALFLAAVQIHRTSTALWAASILALSSAQIEIAQEVRNYPLAMLLCLLSATAVLCIQRRGKAHGWILAVLGFSVLGAMFTHYFVAPVIATLALYSIIRMRGTSRALVVSIIAAAGIGFAILWGPFVLRQSQAFAGAMTEGALLETEPGHVLRTLGRAGSLPLRLLFEARPDMLWAARISAVVYFLSFLLLRSRPQLLLWGIWLCAVVGFATVLDITRDTRHLFQIRHTILAGPALCVILAGALEGSRRILAHGVPALVALACAASLGLAYSREPAERYSEIGQFLADRRYVHEPVVFYSDPRAPFAGHWLFLAASHYSGTFPRTTVRLDGPADAAIRAELRRRSNAVWLVAAAANPDDTEVLPGTERVSYNGVPYVGRVVRLRWTMDQYEP